MGQGRILTARRTRYALAAALLLAATPAAEAHPHVFVDARAELVFDATGQVTAVRHIWQFDQAFSEYAIQGLDANDDGKLSDDELAPLALELCQQGFVLQQQPEAVLGEVGVARRDDAA